MSRIDKNDRHQLFVFVRRKPDGGKCFRQNSQSYRSIDQSWSNQQKFSKAPGYGD